MGPRARTGLMVAGAAAAGLAAIYLLRESDDVAAPPVEEVVSHVGERELPPPAPPPPLVAVLRGRVGPGGPVLSMSDDGPLAQALTYLLSCQGEDGLFHATLGALADDAPLEIGHDIALSGWVALALLDAVEVEGSTPGAVAFKRCLDALATSVEGKALGVVASDLEDLVLATWALAAGYGRTGNPAWRAPLPRSLERILAVEHRDGGWRAVVPNGSGGPSIEEDLLLTVDVVGLLSEVHPMRATFPDSTAADKAIEAAAEWAISVKEGPRPPSRGPAVMALEFLLRSIGESYQPASVPGPDLVTGPPPLRALDHASVLWGSVLRFPRGGKIANDWNREVLVPAGTRQRAEAPGLGSWDPLDARSKRYGRAMATVFEVMAWLFPRVPYRDPRGT